MGDTSHRLTVAVEDEFERLKASDSQYFGATDQRRTRETASLVAEWRGRFGEAIDLGAAVRHDDSNRFGSATTLKADAAWKLGHGLTIHGGYGEGFAQPTRSGEHTSEPQSLMRLPYSVFYFNKK